MVGFKRLFGNIPDEPISDKNYEMERITGKIFHLDTEEGWGFIESSHPSYRFTRIYFHWTALEQDTLKFLELRKEMQVEFEPREFKDKGLRAIRIVVIKDDDKS